MNWPPVWLLMATFKRTEIALRAITSIKENLIYPNLHWHICDDNSGEADDGTGRWHVGVLTEAIGGDVTWHEMDTPHGEFNLGGNTNRGVRTAWENGCDMCFIVCDDDGLVEPWDMRPWVDLLDTYENIGAFRCSELSEGLGVLIDNYKSKRLGELYTVGRVVRDWSVGNCWRTQTYLNNYDMILYHRRFFDAYGWFPEHMHPGLTEVGFCSQYIKSPLGEDGPSVFVPLSKGFGSPWVHLCIGEHDHYYRALIEGKL